MLKQDMTNPYSPLLRNTSNHTQPTKFKHIKNNPSQSQAHKIELGESPITALKNSIKNLNEYENQN